MSDYNENDHIEEELVEDEALGIDDENFEVEEEELEEIFDELDGETSHHHEGT